MKRLILSLICAAAAVCSLTAQEIDADLQKLIVAERAIEALYVDKVNSAALVERAVRAMLEELDPHSSYLTAKEVAVSDEHLNGNFDGIGIQYNMIDDTLFVIQPLSGGPSERAGILAGDRIISANDTVLAGTGLSSEVVTGHLRGPRGTKVRLGVVRAGEKETLYFDVIRDKIPVTSIDAYYMAAPEVGYVKISTFGATTGAEFRKAIQELRMRGMKRLVLDLQGNGGGYLGAAVEVASELLKRGQLIVYTAGRFGPQERHSAHGRGLFQDGELVVLIDEYSASATEIVSGAVQDWDRGLIVGRRSFGKGLVQRPIEFHDGSQIRLTIAKYHTPSGRCIQKPYGKEIDYDADVLSRFNRGELTNADSIHFPDSLRYSTLVERRTVYGGGGIMPDCFVPLDTTRANEFFKQIRNKNVVLHTAVAYVDNHKKQLLSRYKTFDSYLSKFEVREDLLSLFLKKAEEHGVEFDQKEYEENLHIYKVQLKALIARNVWSMNEYYQVLNTLDDSVVKAVELLKKQKSGA